MLRKAFLEVFEDEILSKSKGIVLSDKFYDVDIRNKSITRTIVNSTTRSNIYEMLLQEYQKDDFESMIKAMINMHVRLLTGINMFDIISNKELEMISNIYYNSLLNVMKLAKNESVKKDDIQKVYIETIEGIKEIFREMFIRNEQSISEVISNISMN